MTLIDEQTVIIIENRCYVHTEHDVFCSAISTYREDFWQYYRNITPILPSSWFKGFYEDL
jgi:hypothetical protein